MTTVGHTLTGLCFGALAIPGRWPAPRKALAFAAFALLANAPDAARVFWSHHEYRVSHSLFVNFALIAMLAALVVGSPTLRGRVGGPRILLAGGAAWLSHFVLDSFYNHGRGIAIFWPFSREALALPMPWFSVLPRGWSADPATLRIFGIELVFYGALLALCLAWRRSPGRAPGGGSR